MGGNFVPKKFFYLNVPSYITKYIVDTKILFYGLIFIFEGLEPFFCVIVQFTAENSFIKEGNHFALIYPSFQLRHLQPSLVRADIILLAF